MKLALNTINKQTNKSMMAVIIGYEFLCNFFKFCFRWND
jgi:hypothetical protein